MAGMIAVLLFIQTTPVFAALDTRVYFDSSVTDTGIILADCMMEGEQPVTNAKIRIKYNPEELVLQKTERKEAIADTEAVINDCLQGNKEPGELVVVFASAVPVEASGVMFGMTFQAGAGLNTESGSEIQISVEELAFDGQVVAVTSENAVVGKTTINEENSVNPDDNNNNNSNNNGSSGNDSGKNDTNSNHGNYYSSQSKEENGKKSSVDKGKTDSTVKKATTASVKTGDSSNLFLPIGSCIITLLLAVTIVGKSSKRNRIRE